MPQSRLFQPLRVGNFEISHRMAMAPLTRFRASDEHIPLSFVEEYYTQRASVPGTFIVTEGTFISAAAGGYANVPGIYNTDQIRAWRRITDAVHARGSFIFCQLWALGRTAEPEIAKREAFKIMSSSPNPVDSDHVVPEQMQMEDIQSVINDYAQASENALEAGFDGVEIHGANGYLVDQFLQTNCNSRTDEYGGSVENRSRFGVETVRAVVNAIGAKRTAIRLSPWSTFNGMKMETPVPQFSHFITQLHDFGLAYLHVVESRISGNADVESTDNLDFIIQGWKEPLFIAGGYRPDSARRLVDIEYPEKDIVVMFGRYFISTPDLPFRIKHGLDLNAYNRETFYNAKSKEGYIDYPFSQQFLDGGDMNI
jgi:NADPH2 dehydrogenase